MSDIEGLLMGGLIMGLLLGAATLLNKWAMWRGD
jgi:hypothetical protein